MMEIQYLACLWILLTTQPKHVRGDVKFLEAQVGESVVLPCACDEREPPPFSLSLKRTWLRPAKVLYMHTKLNFTTQSIEDDERMRVSGDPSTHRLNVTITQLRTTDTDRYYCEFAVEAAIDREIPGKTEFFLYVAADTPGSVDIVRVEICAGGSVVLPCLPPHGEGSAMEGVSLKRQKGRAPVEVLYHSKHHHGTTSSSSSSSSPFPPERFLLSTAPSPGGMAYNLTLLQLQPEDSAFYSCHLLLPGRPDSTASLGRRVFFVSVQGGACDCSSYTVLLYALSSAVALLSILLVGLVAIYRMKARPGGKPQAQAPIYEEMVGVKPLGRKKAPCRLEEMDVSTYSNSLVKSHPENHYETSNVPETHYQTSNGPEDQK